jgi:hypothetical protein
MGAKGLNVYVNVGVVMALRASSSLGIDFTQSQFYKGFIERD